jgi:uncharacterized protein (TIGR01244 family)
MMRIAAIPALVAALLFGAGPAGGDAAGVPAPTVTAVELGATANAHEIGQVIVASQPAAADLALARQQGVRRIINLRYDTEPAGFDERAEVARLGIDYVNIPWAGPDELTDAVFDEARRLLRDSPRPLLLHCGSGSRAAAVWLPWRVLDDGADWNTALAEAHELGLASPAFEEKARAYVDRQRAAR